MKPTPTLAAPSGSAKALPLVVLALVLGLAQAQSATYSFSLHGSVDSGVTETYGGASTFYELWRLPLSDMPRYTARAGDVIDATVLLDRSHTISASQPGTPVHLSLDLRGSSYYPEVYGSASTTVSVFNQGVPVFSTTEPIYSSSASGNLSAAIVFYPPNNASLVFDQVRFHFLVTSIGPGVSTLDLRQAGLSTTLTVPVPEPSSGSLLAAGLGGLLLAQWRRLANDRNRTRLDSPWRSPSET